MSALCPLPRALPERLGARVQRAALAPFNAPILRPGPWGLNRKPFNFRELTEYGWVRDEIELGEQLGDQGAAFEQATGAARPAPRASLTRELACPNMLAYSGVIGIAVADAAFGIVTLGALPAPCIIESAGVHWFGDNFQADADWNLVLLDEPLSGEVSARPANLLIQPSFAAPGGLGAFDAQTFGLPFGRSPLATSIFPRQFVHIGRTITETGKYLGFAVRSGGGVVTIAASCVATIQICEPYTATPTARAAPPRPPAQPRADAEPRAPAAPTPQQAIAFPTRAPFFSSSGAQPITALVRPGEQGVFLGTRWTLPEYPGIDFATAAEAGVYAAARQVSALPAAQRAAATARVRTQAGQLIYGAGELASPAAQLLATTTTRPGIVTPRKPGPTFSVAPYYGKPP